MTADSVISIQKVIEAPARGLNRVQSARYVGIGVTKFDQLVQEHRMPQPKKIDNRKVWDIRALDLYFDDLPDDDVECRKTGPNTFDDIVA